MLPTSFDPLSHRAAPYRVLVVDDDRDVRHLLTYVLQDLGYEAVCARNGQEALELLRDAVANGCAPDLIMLDLHMPVMDGREFRARQKADPSLAKIHVVAVSSDWDAHLDSDATLRKPINLDTLVATLHQFHKGRTAETATARPGQRLDSRHRPPPF